MTDSNFTSTTQNAPQRAAHWLFHHFRSWRALAFLAVITVLSAISIRFNYALGQLMASDQLTRELFPAGFGTLDVCALLLASWITIRGAPFIRKAIAWTWFSFLLTLSIFACMAFVIASDARLAQSGYDTMRDSKVRALQQAEQEVQVAQRNYESTTNYKQLRKAELLHAQQYRDQLIKDVGRLDSDNPHVSQAIFFRIAALLDFKYEPEEISTVVRMAWSLALVLSPFVMVALLAFELGSTNCSTPNSGRKRPASDEQSTFPSGKTERPPETPSNLAPAYRTAMSPRNSGDVEEIELDQEALGKARAWVQQQPGRVQRQQIQYRSGQSKYKQTSLIIERLLDEGVLIRLGNGQLKAQPSLRAVI